MISSGRGTFGMRAVGADECELLRHGIVSVLARLHVRVVAEASTPAEVQSALHATSADLLVVGQLDGDLGETIARAKALPSLPLVVALLPATAGGDLARLVDAGADALLTRLAGVDELKRAVAEAAAGGRYIAAAPLSALVGHLPAGSTDEAAHGLTRRELEVLRQVAEGRSNKEIAGVLYLSLPTVKTHLAHIYDKLGVAKRTRAVGRALELGLLS